MFNINGEIRKAVKSKLLECFKMEEVIAHFWQVAVADMWFLWRKCIPIAVNRDQVVNKFIWRDYTQKYYNSITSSKYQRISYC